MGDWKNVFDKLGFCGFVKGVVAWAVKKIRQDERIFEKWNVFLKNGL
jgi:hypothetical protein